MLMLYQPMAIDSEPPSAPVKKGPPPLSSRQPAKTTTVKQVKLAGPPPGISSSYFGTSPACGLVCNKLLIPEEAELFVYVGEKNINGIKSLL